MHFLQKNLHFMIREIIFCLCVYMRAYSVKVYKQTLMGDSEEVYVIS